MTTIVMCYQRVADCVCHVGYAPDSSLIKSQAEIANFRNSLKLAVCKCLRTGPAI
jgi:hypothetical protein